MSGAGGGHAVRRGEGDVSLTPQEYVTLVEQAPILIWRADTTSACDYFNERWLSFTGRTLQQEAGAGWAEGVHPDDYNRCLAEYLTAFERREPFEVRYRLRRHDGCYRWIFDRGVPVFDPDGTFGGYIGSCIDVTAQVEAELALEAVHRAEVARLQELLPICAGCKQVRDDAGYWQQIESYFLSHTGQQFSHGLCPTCAASYFPDVSEDR
jgi:PAS domain S-box-containing protein